MREPLRAHSRSELGGRLRSRLAVALVATTTPLQRIALSLHTVERPVDAPDANHVVGLAPRSAFAPTRSQHAPMPSRGVYPRLGSDAGRPAVPRYPCQTFADRLRAYRRARDWGQVDLAKTIGVNKDTVRNW